MQALAVAVRLIEAALRAVAALCLAAMFLLLIAQVVLRYAGGGVPVFTEEVARYAMIWMALLASAVAVREGSHIRIDLVPALLRHIAPWSGRALDVLLDLIGLAVFLILLREGIGIVEFAASQKSEGLRIPLSWPYLSIPLAFLFASLFALARLFLHGGNEA
ncbi:TRAP transporter small permease [Paracoccus sp. (in: a-proteobacteria)]|uniref:TRAP transporter small permease n=1 Tax=Paracoccus sp. TaxID=267 RepID=UPI003A84DDCF